MNYNQILSKEDKEEEAEEGPEDVEEKAPEIVLSCQSKWASAAAASANP